MTDFLIYSTESSVTGKALGEELGIPHGPNLPQQYFNNLIRWGNRASINPIPGKVWNKLAALKLASEKYDSLVSLDYAGIRVPPFGLMPKSYPCLGRKHSHTQGKDIVLCMQESDLQDAKDNGCSYFVSYIPTKAEYRIHVFDGEILKISQKVFSSDFSGLKVPWIRNHEYGYIFVNPRRQLSTIDSALAVEAVKNMGLNFGAVDLIISDDGFPYILEVNTAPALGEDSLTTYVNIFRIKLGLNNE